MPLWHEAARFGEQQKQNPIDDDERFIEEPRRVNAAARR